MSNYVKTVNFAAKDALAHLNPAKVAKGTEIDTELNNIATAIATKEETTNKNAANGYAGLDATSKLLKANQYANTAYLDSTNAFTLATTFAGTSTFNAGVTINSTLGVTGAVSFTTALPITSGGTGASAATGSGSVVLQTSPTLVTPALGTPVSGNLANCSFPTLNQNTTGTAGGLSATLGVLSGGTGVTSSTGSGSVVLNTSPTLVTPALGTPVSGNLANCTFPTLNQSTTGNAATATVASSCSGNSATATTATSATTATTATNVSGTVAIGNGGTGQTTAQAALNAFIGVTTGNFVRGNGTNAAVQLMTFSNGADAFGGSDGDVWFRYN